MPCWTVNNNDLIYSSVTGIAPLPPMASSLNGPEQDLEVSSTSEVIGKQPTEILIFSYSKYVLYLDHGFLKDFEI